MGQKKENVDLGLRKFIKDLGYLTGGAALLATTPWLQSFTTDEYDNIKKDKVRVALIGTGSRGIYHIHNLLKVPHAEITALCDDYLPNLKLAMELCPKAKTYENYKLLLESPDVDAVVISTPLGMHAPMVLDSLSAGKHTFCEKSMALTMDECRDIYGAYKNTDKVLYFGMQRLYDEKYVKALQMIHQGVIGDVVGMRCHWFRNHNWRKPVEDISLERKINWRLYRESSAGLMTELATHQLEVSNWALKTIPEAVIGMGDIVYWKDGREVYDSVSLTYKYKGGIKTTYESLIANKYNGMGEQVLGNKGTMELAKGLYYFEEPSPAAGIEQLLKGIEDKVFSSIPIAGPSWIPEIAKEYKPNYVIDKNVSINPGVSMTGVDDDGSFEMLDAFCQAAITGERMDKIVEECYYSTILCLLGNIAMDEQRKVDFPEEYKIDYLNSQL